MKLNMYIDDVLVHSVPISRDKFEKVKNKQLYLENIARRLAYEHREKLMSTRHTPKFYLEYIPSKINRKKV